MKAKDKIEVLQMIEELLSTMQEQVETMFDRYGCQAIHEKEHSAEGEVS